MIYTLQYPVSFSLGDDDVGLFLSFPAFDSFIYFFPWELFITIAQQWIFQMGTHVVQNTL